MDRRIVRKSMQNPKLTAPELLDSIKPNVSVRTVQRRLTEVGLNGRVAAKKPFVSKKNMKKRMDFARRHLEWTIKDWEKVLFSDESKFNLINSDGVRYVRRPINERYNPSYTIGTFKHGGGSIMVWGSFSALGVSPIHRINGIMDQYQYRNILQEVMKPYADQVMPVGWIFQHDNDPKHTAKSVKNWFIENNMRVLEWPAQSPDLNPIENLWSMVERALNGQKFQKPDDLFNAIKKAWNELSITLLTKLIHSMPDRCKAVLKTKGAPTKY